MTQPLPTDQTKETAKAATIKEEAADHEGNGEDEGERSPYRRGQERAGGRASKRLSCLASRIVGRLSSDGGIRAISRPHRACIGGLYASRSVPSFAGAVANRTNRSAATCGRSFWN